MRWAAFRGQARTQRFNSRPTRCRTGVMHHSAMEAARCDELAVMEHAGLIRELEAHPQPAFDLVVNGVTICRYLGDFAYVDTETGQRVVEDVKGYAGDTKEYQLKRRLMLAVHGIEVQEVRNVRGRR